MIWKKEKMIKSLDDNLIEVKNRIIHKISPKKIISDYLDYVQMLIDDFDLEYELKEYRMLNSKNTNTDKF